MSKLCLTKYWGEQRLAFNGQWLTSYQAFLLYYAYPHIKRCDSHPRTFAQSIHQPYARLPLSLWNKQKHVLLCEACGLFLWSEPLSECPAHSGTFHCYSFFWCSFVLYWMHPNLSFPSSCSFQLLLWLILKPRCRFSWSWNHQLHGTVSVQEFMWSGAVSLPIKLKTKISFIYLSWPMQNLSGGKMC